MRMEAGGVGAQRESTRPPATAAAEPLEEPPGILSGHVVFNGVP